MKTINKLFGLLGAFSMSLAFNACTEEADYTPAEQLSGAQVYFASNASQVDLDRTATSFDIEINRINTEESLTVSLKVTNESGLFTIPSSVSFAAGEATGKLSIGYSLETLGYANYQPITLEITDETLTTPYGTSSYSFKAGIPSPYKTLGFGTFNDAFMFENTYQVEIQQSEVDPKSFRLVDPYTEGMNQENKELMTGNQSPYLEFTIMTPGATLGGVTITQEDLVYFSPTYTGLGHPNYDAADVYLLHPVNFTTLRSEDKWLHNAVLSYQDNGLPAVVQLAPLYYMDGVGGFNYSQYDGMITIVFPGVVLKDYSVSVEYQGRFTNVDDENYAVAQVELGEDVESAKLVMVEGNDINAAVGGILNGSLETIEVTASGTVNIPSSYNGTCSIVIISYGDGEPQELDYTTFEFSAGSKTWTSLGMASYTDDIVASLYGAPNATYEVEVEEDSENPGLYRLVNPYGEAYPYNESGDWDDSKNYYMVINAQDPEGVYIDRQSTGLNWGDGTVFVYSYAAYFLDGGASLEEVKAEGYCGTLADGVITFPTKGLLAGLEGSSDLYYANVNGAFKVVLPSAAESKAAARALASTSHIRISKVLDKENRIDKRWLKPADRSLIKE